MSLFSRLFGGTAKSAPEPERYEGFLIHPEPVSEGGRWRVAARIEKDGREHRMIRADSFENEDTAVEAAILKGKRLIDEQGEGIFG